MDLATVVICTHNRSRAVGRCLAALHAQAVETKLPVLVVDSGSDDGQATELRHLIKSYGVGYVRLEQPGLSQARNTAYNRASSEWIVYLDDDAIPDPGWAKCLLSVLSTAPADMAIIGGKILPEFPEGAQPPRITERWKLLLSCVDRKGRGLVSDGFNICGANFAIRRSALQRTSGFPTTLGRTGTRLIGGEESYMIEFLFDLGLVSAYSDAFSVRHCIVPERLERRWAGKRAYWEGVSRVRIAAELCRPRPRSMRTSKLIVSLPVLFVLHLVSKNPDWTIRYYMALGSLRAGLEMQFQGNSG